MVSLAPIIKYTCIYWKLSRWAAPWKNWPLSSLYLRVDFELKRNTFWVKEILMNKFFYLIKQFHSTHSKSNFRLSFFALVNENSLTSSERKPLSTVTTTVASNMNALNLNISGWSQPMNWRSVYSSSRISVSFNLKKTTF